MGLVVLLLNPEIKKFELIQFPEAPASRDLSIDGVLRQAEASASHVELKKQRHVGLYCPKTQQVLRLPPRPQDAPHKEDPPGATATANDVTNDTDPLIAEENGTSELNNLDDKLQSSDPPSTSKSDEVGHAEVPSTDESGTSSDQEVQTTKTPFAQVGHILVAIPDGRTVDEITKMSAAILKSPSFAILTQGTSNSALYRIENTSTTQELQRLQKQGLTRQVASQYEKQAQSNQRSAEFHQKQTQQLKERREEQKQQAPQSCAKRVSSVVKSPDTHGLSPLDALRVAQNKEKAAARQKEQETRQTYQHHADNGLLVKPASTQTHITPSPAEAANSIPTESPPPSHPEIPVYASSHEISSPKNELEALRQQGQLSAVDASRNNGFFSPATDPEATTDKTAALEAKREQELGALHGASVMQVEKIVSPSEERRKSIEAQKKHELEVLVQISSGTDTETETLSPSEQRRALIEAQKRKELEELAAVQGSSLRTLSISKEKRQLSSTSQSELEALRGKGLAQSIKDKFAEAERSSALANKAHQAQIQDLEARKAKTSSFEVSRNSLHLSAADAKALELSQLKKQERAKERQAMGYYQSQAETNTPDDKAIGDENEEWKTKGKVHISQRTTNTYITKEWEAADGIQSPSAVTHTTIGSPSDAGLRIAEGGKEGKSGTTTSRATTSGSKAVDQGCSCTLM